MPQSDTRCARHPASNSFTSSHAATASTALAHDHIVIAQNTRRDPSPPALTPVIDVLAATSGILRARNHTSITHSKDLPSTTARLGSCLSPTAPARAASTMRDRNDGGREGAVHALAHSGSGGGICLGCSGGGYSPLGNGQPRSKGRCIGACGSKCRSSLTCLATCSSRIRRRRSKASLQCSKTIREIATVGSSRSTRSRRRLNRPRRRHRWSRRHLSGPCGSRRVRWSRLSGPSRSRRQLRRPCRNRTWSRRRPRR